MSIPVGHTRFSWAGNASKVPIGHTSYSWGARRSTTPQTGDPILQRLSAIESALKTVRGVPQQLTLGLKRTVKGIHSCGVLGASLHKVAPSYYDWHLAERARALGCLAPHLCKTVILENKNSDGDASAELTTSK